MAAKKRPAAPRKRLRKAVPPPDDPLLRHEEMEVDRLVAGMPEISETGRQAARSPSRGPARGKAARVAESPMMVLARMRLAAMATSRAMPGPEAAARAVRRGLAGRRARVLPVPGVSNWVQLGPVATPRGQTNSTARVLVTGRVTAIVLDPTAPGTIYIGTAQGGVWKTADGGRNWHPKSDHEVSLAIGALAMDPGDPQTLYAGTGEGNFSQDSYYGNGILKTTDGGDTWANLAPATFMGKRFTRLAVTAGTPDRLFAATTAGLYRSADGGETWAPLAGLPAGAATDVAIDPAAPATVYAAVWGKGIFKSANAGAAGPRWTRLPALPESGFTRISLALAPSSPGRLYALAAGPAADLYPIDRFLASADSGESWTAIPLPGGSIGKQGFYNLVLAADPRTPDIVYLGGVSLWKATRSTATGAWTVREIGRGIHPDQHVVAVDPRDDLVVYAGNDGGIYCSADGGETWSDTINEGPCLTQFEFIDQHPTSAAVVFGGTQDNGTAQYRNSPVFLHADDGDGGHCLIDRGDPRIVLSTYYGATPKRSTRAGELGTWMDVSPGLEGQSLFYPPLAMDETDPKNVALGTDRINLDSAQGTGGWPVKVALPGITGKVSALHYVHSRLLFAGTTQGEVYRLARGGDGSWGAEPIHASLPARWIWEVAARPDDPDTVLVALSGFGTPHVWSGRVPPGGGRAAWTDVSSNLPDVPVNALAIDPAAPDTWYIATDVAVYRTEDAGGSWVLFSQGLPNCAVFDLRLHAPTRLLRAATHGRGLWERQLDVPASPPVELYFRDHLMATGRGPSAGGVTAAFADPLHHVALGDRLWWWESADLKVDALEGDPPAHQMPAASVDYAAFESRLQHRRPQRGRVNRVYVQVHNRGFAPGADVVVKLLWANAAAGLPPLPADFWTAFPGDAGDAAHWHPVGAAQVLPALSATEPAVLAWDWSTPPTPPGSIEHVCLLAVMDCPADPIPESAKAFDLGTLVPNERRVALKSLHLVDAPVPAGVWTPVELHAPAGTAPALRLLPSGTSGWTVALFLPPGALSPAAIPEGFAARRPAQSLLRDLERRLGATELRKYDTARLYTFSTGALRARLPDLRVPRGGLRLLLGLTPPSAGATQGARLTLSQERGDQVAGGCTFVLRARR